LLLKHFNQLWLGVLFSCRLYHDDPSLFALVPQVSSYSILSVDAHFWPQPTTYIDDNNQYCKLVTTVITSMENALCWLEIRIK
jgi:hypothetical protein